MFVEKGKIPSAFDAEKDMTAATPRRPPEALKDLGSYNFSGSCRHVMHTAAGQFARRSGHLEKAGHYEGTSPLIACHVRDPG